MEELVTEAQDSRNCSSLLLAAYRTEKKKKKKETRTYPIKKLDEIEKMCATY